MAQVQVAMKSSIIHTAGNDAEKKGTKVKNCPLYN